MSVKGCYGDAVALSHGLKRAPSLVSTIADGARVGVTKIATAPGEVGMRRAIPPEDTLIAALFLVDVPYNELWKRGRPYLKQGYAAGSLRLVNLEDGLSSYIAHPQLALSFYIPRQSLAALTDDGGPMRAELSCDPGIVDPVMAHLGRALLPALDRPAEAAPLFVDHLFLSILHHLVDRHGDAAIRRAPRQGGLSKSHERRAKEYLASASGRDPTLVDVAAACGLSRSHFIRAFRQTTGTTPHRWVQLYRIARAKEALRGGRMTLAEVAIHCGFADQSHFTRVFGKLAGVTPKTWRRLHAE